MITSLAALPSPGRMRRGRDGIWPGSRRNHRRRGSLQVHSLWRTDVRRQPLHAATQADAVGRRARRAGVHRARAAGGPAPDAAARAGGLLRSARHLAGNRGLPHPQRLVARASARREAAGHGVAARRRVLLRHRQCAAAAGDAAGEARRRRRGHGQSAAEHLRLPRPVRGRRRGFRTIGQRRHARHDRSTRMGARQYRSVRRRSGQRDDLRRVRRRRQSLHAARDAVGARAVPPRHRAERRAPCGCASAIARHG